jgi:hypothetical protein
MARLWAIVKSQLFTFCGSRSDCRLSQARTNVIWARSSAAKRSCRNRARKSYIPGMKRS